MKKHAILIVYMCILTLFTVYGVLDAFVIPRDYNDEVSMSTSSSRSFSILKGTPVPSESTEEVLETEKISPEPTSDSSAETAWENTAETTIAPSPTPSPTPTATPFDGVILTDTMYKDSEVEINISEERYENTTIHLADVKITDIERLKTALANGKFGRHITEKTSEIAEDNNAIFAINGDYYGAQESGYVIRNGVLYRSTSRDGDDLAINYDGTFRLFYENDYSAEEILNSGAYQVFDFGPWLVNKGEIVVAKNAEVDVASTSNPRTAIAMYEPGHYLFLVSDGRTDDDEGLTLYQLATFLKSKGVAVAYNLDGGGSSTMWFNGKILNTPTTDGKKIKERSISDIVYISR